MNRAYKLVWNAVSNSWMVASELAKSGKKSSGKALKLAVLLAAGLTAGMTNAAPATNALPTGESVASGSATFDRSVTNQLTVNQSSSKLITNWNSFDVGSNGKVVFAQPDATSIALNRVSSGSATEIFGQVSANGQLLIVNPNGITFGAGSQVSAASIIGSVLDINDSDFNAGTLLFSRGAATGTIDNKGALTATAGSVSLLAPTVKNSGTITSTGGNAALINADVVDVTVADPVISIASTITGLIQQSGNITATQVSALGGKILLTGDISQTGSQIKLAGTLDATTETAVNGRSIQVTSMLDINGTNNTLNLTHVDGYSLTGGAVNLNGANSGFSVNGTAYSVIRDVTQLQNMRNNLNGKYVLANDIDASATSTWNSGAGFKPIGVISGNGSTEFKGRLDGLGHVVSGLYINRPGEDDVALLGATYSASISNIGLSNVNLTGHNFIAGLTSDASLNTHISNSFVSGGSISGYSRVGGLVGYLYAGSTLSNSYSSVSVGGIDKHVGGLVGVIQNATISGSYASGAVNKVGDSVGGLVGGSINGIVIDSYWNTTTSKQALAVGSAFTSIQTNAVGLTDVQSTQLASYANWGSNIDAQGGTGSIWRIYDGQSGPLLRSFLKPLNVNINNNVTKTYDATSYVAGAANYTISGVYDAGKVLGTAVLSGDAIGARNAGTYNISGSGLYSNQQGYDISYVDGTLTINKRLLTISATAASKVYDGKLTSSDKPILVGRQRGDSIVGLTQSYTDKNAGTGKTINVGGGYIIRDGNNGDNYTVVVVNSSAGVITPKALTISTVANSKVYDGGVTSASKPIVSGLITGDRLTGLFQQYETKTVGTNKKLLIKSGYVVEDGNSGGNYTVTEQGSNDGTISSNVSIP